ncbi:putative MAPEG superfamily protein [Sphingomonas sp. SORGH_AS870]|uniref:MAPEG family protein n=1 Tax=Sphingomonas sp. SORGH_AS_0870 TaxID=3041801 RepID=UPI00285C84CF|nr:MAPEG family protein [Sphingomonas sp. SORGH_AS_0870]MDR6147055.1 putative MAPEG superfamily protein [Sphingomonas sp. SORGH_AS_0870]
MTTELTILGWSIILFFVHLALQSQLATLDRGIGWNAGPRDGTPAPLGPLAGRAERASANYRETWPVFIALALGVALTGRSGGMAATGAWIWFLARVAYVPLYLFGVRYVRSLAYLVSMAGLVMMLIRFL